MLMNALQVVRPRAFEQVRIAVPHMPSGGDDCILVRTAWVSLCGSDIPFFTGNKRHITYPLLPGAPIHECIGEVVESASALFRPGDRVLSIPDGDKGLAEYFLAKASRTVALDTAIDDYGAACLIQPLSTVLNAVDRLGNLRGRSVAVLGLGSIGLMFCRLTAQDGASSVIGIDPCAYRCRIAEALGATRTLCSRGIEVVQGARMAPSAWEPPDVCIEAVGHQMETVNDCLELVRKRGTVVAFGVPDQPVYALEYEVFFRKNALLMSAVTPDWKEYLQKAQDVFRADKDGLPRLVTHRLPIREAGKAFNLYERHEDDILKAVLDAGSW
jgi:2-desacetyl-2-hydroxyethyl bacteriochlorophyllide A dehydrogenase